MTAQQARTHYRRLIHNLLYKAWIALESGNFALHDYWNARAMQAAHDCVEKAQLSVQWVTATWVAVMELCAKGRTYGQTKGILENA